MRILPNGEKMLQANKTIETKPKTPQEIRDSLCKNSEYKNKSQSEYQAYVNGVLDTISELEKNAP